MADLKLLSMACLSLAAWSGISDVAGDPATQLRGSVGKYTLDFYAHGQTFFEGFDFKDFDGNHGAADYVASYSDAVQANVVQTFDNHAILRVGNVSHRHKYKRVTAKVQTRKKWTYFLAAVRFSHVPWGCGVWPAFWTVGDSWPAGGETDILEYANDGGSYTSFHTNKQCKLDAQEVSKFGVMPDLNFRKDANNESYNCYTHYCADCKSLGCAPNKMPVLTGEQWAARPGVIAMERTKSYVKLFFVPENEIPMEFQKDEPKPETWDAWIIAYYPFAASEAKNPGSCENPDNIMTAQRFVFNIAFCGDWASKVWGTSPSCAGHVGPTYIDSNESLSSASVGSQCRAVDPQSEYSPQQDCCTRFITDEQNSWGADEYLDQRAFFNISWMKVYTAAKD